ncbi:lecithin retinol acyltransferase domain-containing protein [Ditylenchus destructor]|uniref:Lecithin retinol acyltransferase domain-containing protein n=1 Tax=Ditylenchus destructor TaxID=166010 RepID=A0AAD4MHF6_9BILA|nr:lecithin retinol acyltransferase domain-containing protein [Ditylenchus destructor]
MLLEQLSSTCPIEISKRTTRVTMRFGLTSEAEIQKKKLEGEWFNVDELPEKYNGQYPLEVGDLVEIRIHLGKTIKIPATHWAIYIGDGNIISLRGVKDKTTNNKWHAQICQNEIVNTRYKNTWMRKNNYLDLFFPRFSKEVILERAHAKVGCKYDYKLLYFNCEHFVNFIVYDQVFSVQEQPNLTADGGARSDDEPNLTLCTLRVDGRAEGAARQLVDY